MGTHDTPHSLSLCHTYALFSRSAYVVVHPGQFPASVFGPCGYYASYCILDYHNHRDASSLQYSIVRLQEFARADSAAGRSTALDAAGFTTTAGPLAPTNSVAGNHSPSNSIPASFGTQTLVIGWLCGITLSPSGWALAITAVLGSGVDFYTVQPQSQFFRYSSSRCPASLGNSQAARKGCIYREGLFYNFCMEKSSLPWNMDPNFINVGQSYSTVRRTPPTTLVGEKFCLDLPFPSSTDVKIRLLSIGSSAGFCLATRDY
ncbi:uncharacterized protein BO96DRAFT_345176 [Aspergillus niger CBS 101883]|uniref:uncharacterized protein n=1 Tax=Aspergillus lacticoffeatus (strain CBS 101883) TaxID=1450533 RepID=UPI000D7F02FF|nr:uncharacterized protein BO96DRAFT_345176 [Aspergillus niger CBS 101883]PYH53413.1 hypothetical protein BO96DRAFT_345176 [Aspergillus niger CBS 101883]